MSAKEDDLDFRVLTFDRDPPRRCSRPHQIRRLLRPRSLQSSGPLGWVDSRSCGHHALIDQHIDLHEPNSDEMSIHQAAAALSLAGVFVWWMLMTARAAGGDAKAVRATVWMVLVFAALSNGLVAFAAAPPPSSAFPYQDVAHGAALVTGLVAARRMWSTVGWGPPGREAQLTVVLLIANMAVGSPLMLSNL